MENKTNNHVQSEWKREYTITTDVPVEAAWEAFKNVAEWHMWLGTAELVGEFKAGSKVIIGPEDRNSYAIEIADVQEGRSFTFASKLAGNKLDETLTFEEGRLGYILRYYGEPNKEELAMLEDVSNELKYYIDACIKHCSSKAGV